MIHRLKTWPKSFKEIKKGTKTFDIRKCKPTDSSGRNFKVGDILVLQEFIPCKECCGFGRAMVPGGPDFDNCCEKPYGKYTGR